MITLLGARFVPDAQIQEEPDTNGIEPESIHAEIEPEAHHFQHLVENHRVTVATPPEDYEQQLTPMFSGTWTHLCLTRAGGSRSRRVET